jgi:hypothetical protein
LRGSILFAVFCSSKLQCLLDSILGMLLIYAVTPETSQTGRQNANRNSCLRSRRVTWIFQLYPHPFEILWLHKVAQPPIIQKVARRFVHGLAPLHHHSLTALAVTIIIQRRLTYRQLSFTHFSFREF